MELYDNTGVQVGDHNVLYIFKTEQREIGLGIRHTNEEFAPGGENYFYLDIWNRTSKLKNLELAIERVPSSVIQLESTTFPLSDRDTKTVKLILRCTAIEPMAGEVPLQVVVFDKDTDRVLMESDPVRILIPRNPRLAGRLVLSDRVYSQGRYPAVLTLENTGNTDLRVTLRTLPLPNGTFHHLGDGSVELSSQPFQLGHKTSKKIEVKLHFPPQEWADRSWQVLIGVDLAGSTETGQPLQLGTVIQYGIWSELRRHASQQATRFATWSSETEKVRRGWLLGGSLVLLIAGLLIGLFAASPPESPHTAQTPVAAPITLEPQPMTTSSVATTTGADLTYTDLPCEPGTKILMLKPLSADETAAHAKWLLDMESARLKTVATEKPELRGKSVRISRRDAICPAIFTGYEPREQFVTFIWLGPVTASEATSLCATLDKPNANDCLPLPTR